MRKLILVNLRSVRDAMNTAAAKFMNAIAAAQILTRQWGAAIAD
jgi:hypothetical protein